ncbi:hypothetical protein AK812_SmicGene38573 [Symbiodinium microadriaticum]|uniref:Uncharacterized protein n=1 Tax=Symbiodinium microadriaticum TaxID=2951 RepID=A0A1Q9CDF7_SYMMI|nr:hypothetical protein AK812_SmicGene38573 [Symbiodinium microadriaticum]
MLLPGTLVILVPKGTKCQCTGQNSFSCDFNEWGYSWTECLPIEGGYCPPTCADGEVSCPGVDDYMPAKACPGSSMRCIFKDEECPVVCGDKQKKCWITAPLPRPIVKSNTLSLPNLKNWVPATDFTQSGEYISDREICVGEAETCPCGQGTQRCPGEDICLLASEASLFCPCTESEKQCNVVDYTSSGKQTNTSVQCINKGAKCPCGANSLVCPDPNNAEENICRPKYAGTVLNSCPKDIFRWVVTVIGFHLDLIPAGARTPQSKEDASPAAAPLLLVRLEIENEGVTSVAPVDVAQELQKQVKSSSTGAMKALGDLGTVNTKAEDPPAALGISDPTTTTTTAGQGQGGQGGDSSTTTTAGDAGSSTTTTPEDGGQISSTSALSYALPSHILNLFVARVEVSKRMRMMVMRMPNNDDDDDDADDDVDSDVDEDTDGHVEGDNDGDDVDGDEEEEEEEDEEDEDDDEDGHEEDDCSIGTLVVVS